MRLYLIALPLFTNSGDSYADAHEQWRRKALDLAGGFTELGDAHVFLMDRNKLYTDRIRQYQVACEPEQWAALIDVAFRLFLDQVSMFHADIGKPEIVSRQEWQASQGCPCSRDKTTDPWCDAAGECARETDG
jgi:hypothetical protein